MYYITIFKNYHVSVPTSLWLWWLLFQVSICQLFLSKFTFLSEFIFLSRSFALGPQFLMGPQNIVDFQFVQIFPCTHRNGDFHVLYMSELRFCICTRNGGEFQFLYVLVLSEPYTISLFHVLPQRLGSPL